MQDWWNSTVALDRINTWAQVATVVFGILVASATALKIVAANRLSSIQATRAADLHARLSKAETTTQELRASLEAAQRDQAQTTVHLKEEVEKARATASLAEGKAQEAARRAAARVIGEAQRATTLHELRAHIPQAVNITSLLGDSEAHHFALQLEGLLAGAGWPNKGVAQAVFDQAPEGVIIIVKDAQHPPEGAAILQRALADMGIEAPGQIQPEMSAGEIRIIVGRKP